MFSSVDQARGLTSRLHVDHMRTSSAVCRG